MASRPGAAIYPDPDDWRALKHVAIDDGESVSAIVSDLIRVYVSTDQAGRARLRGRPAEG